jgi:hypothetical protein
MISLAQLTLAPAQILGSIRLVPILRDHSPGDLRLFQRPYEADLTITKLNEQNLSYYAYVPYGVVLSWSDDGTPAVANDTQLFKADGKRRKLGGIEAQWLQGMAKPVGPNQVRFLPMHLAIEGFLGMYFSGPRFAWKDYSKAALSEGLGCRYEYVWGGRSIAGLEAALRIFEIHDNQVGVMVFVAEALASICVVPSPADYRLMHRSLIEDFYGELIYQYSQHYDETWVGDRLQVDDAQISSLEELSNAIDQIRTDWADTHQFMAAGVLDRPLETRSVYSNAKFTLERFMTMLHLDGDNYVGEQIVRPTGELEYLKLFRLSGDQTRRVFLLQQLDRHDWSIDATAKALGCDRGEFIRRMERAGWGYLLNNAVRTKGHF